MVDNKHIPKHLHPCSWIKELDQFFHFDSPDCFLVLYTMANRNYLEDFHGETGKFERIPRFVEPKKWVSLMHQTAGYACHSYYLHARFLKPKKDIREGLFQEILENYNDSCICRVTSLETAVKYEELLKKYGLSANRSYEFLEEGFYPIDIEYLNKVTSERFPKNLQTLVKNSKKEGKLWSFLNYTHFGLAILGPNCD